MKLAQLSKNTIERIRALRFDRILEKHEGPWDWSHVLDYYEPEILNFEGYHLLFPVPRKNHRNINMLRFIMSNDEQTATVFLKDTTHCDDPDFEKFDAGRIAICKRLQGESIYIAYVYHEWFIIPELE